MSTYLTLFMKNGRSVTINPAFIVWIEGEPTPSGDPNTVIHTTHGTIEVDETYDYVVGQLRKATEQKNDR